MENDFDCYTNPNHNILLAGLSCTQHAAHYIQRHSACQKSISVKTNDCTNNGDKVDFKMNRLNLSPTTGSPGRISKRRISMI